MRRGELLLAVCMVGLSAGPALSSQPNPTGSLFPLLAGDQYLWEAITVELAECSDRASARGLLGDIIVHYNELVAGAPIAIEATAGLSSEIVVCARNAVERALHRSVGWRHTLVKAVPGWGASRSFPVGRPTPLLPSLPRLLQIWTAKVSDVRRDLRTMLPAGVTIDADNCLSIHWTENFQQSFQLWMAQTGARLPLDASERFARVQNPHAIPWARAQHSPVLQGMVRHQAVLSSPPWLLVVDHSGPTSSGLRRPGYRPTRMCLHRLKSN